MRWQVGVLCGLLLIVCCNVGAQNGQPSRSGGTKPSDASVRDDDPAQKVIELTNAERVRQGLPPLKREEKLMTSAHWLAQDMAEKGYFSHTDSMGRGIPERIHSFGVPEAWTGENIAWGRSTPEKVVKDWMNSQPHRENILKSQFNLIGVGCVKSARNSALYYVQNFAGLENVYPVVINGEEAVTRNRAVWLYVYGKGNAKEMRLSSDGEKWTDWQPFREEITWQLEAGRGERRVYVQLRDGKGKSRTTYDMIWLEPLEESDTKKGQESG